MSDREIRSCTTEDGVLIAYSVAGDGPPLLVCHEGLESFTLDHLITGQEAFFEELGRGRQVIRYDPRGVGLSQRDIDDFSVEAATRDLLAVVEATGRERVSIFAPCGGTFDAISFAARHPARVDRLVLYSAQAAVPRAFHATLASIAQLWRTSPRMAAQTWSDMADRGAHPELCAQLARAITQSVKPQDAVAYIDQLPLYDVNGFLPHIQAPTLVINRRGDHGNPIALAQGVAARIPGARLAMLEGDAHWYSMDPGGALLAAIAAFLPEARTPAAAPHASGSREDAALTATGTAVILFTDIVSSTALTERMGDAAFRDAARALEAGLRAAIRDAGGAAIDRSLGDGVLATFPSAAQAIDGARRCLELSVAAELGLHIGLHAGDVIREENNVYGGAVNIASRICGLCAPGEILVSDVVRGMARSSAGVQFEDRGEQEMKGVGDAVHLYEVKWD